MSTTSLHAYGGHLLGKRLLLSATTGCRPEVGYSRVSRFNEMAQKKPVVARFYCAAAYLNFGKKKTQGAGLRLPHFYGGSLPTTLARTHAPLVNAEDVPLSHVVVSPARLVMSMCRGRRVIAESWERRAGELETETEPERMHRTFREMIAINRLRSCCWCLSDTNGVIQYFVRGF